jgi:hypothetical protein
MAKHTTRWSPDTCGCVIEYVTDDDLPEQDPVLGKIVKLCGDHAGAIGDVFSVVAEENRRKNGTFAELEKSVKDMKVENYLWYFDAQRILHVEVMDLSPVLGDKESAQAACDARFGDGKVVIH